MDTLHYAYDPATGLETEVWTTNASGATVTDTHYAYDQAGELTTVTVTTLDGQTLTPPLVTAYSYDLNGNLILTQNANGTTEARTYNKLNELTSIVDNNSLGVYARFAYTYDPAGHVQTETDLDGRTDTYTYDKLYRLIDDSITDPALGDSSYAYTYDLVGNRVTETDTSASGQQTEAYYSYDANDELRSVSIATAVLQNYYYDADGNTITVTDGSSNLLSSYTWDPSGRMIGAATAVSVPPNHTPRGRAGRLTVAAPPGSPAPGVIMHASISRSRRSRGYPVREGRGPATPFPRLWFRAQPPT